MDGDVTLQDFLGNLNLLPKYRPNTDILIVHFENTETFTDIAKIAESLRKTGLNISLADPTKKIGDQIKYAEKLHIPFVCIIGEDELKSNKLKLKYLEDRKEFILNIDEIYDVVKNYGT